MCAYGKKKNRLVSALVDLVHEFSKDGLLETNGFVKLFNET